MVAPVLAEIDVEVGHRHALRIEETLEQQRVAQRIEVGDAERVRDQRARARSPSGADRHAVVLRPVDEVGDDQEVAGETHLDDRLGLELETRDVFRPLRVALGRVRVEQRKSLLQARRRFVLQMLLDGYAGRGRKVGQIILAQWNRQVAALRDGYAVGERVRHVGEALRHLVLRHEILFGSEALRAARVREHVALGDAHARLVRAKLVAAQELHRMRGDNGQIELRGEAHRGRGQRIVIAFAGALHFKVVAVGKQLGPGRRGFRRARGVALAEAVADVAATKAGECDQARGAFGEPFALDLRAAAMLVAAIGAGQPLGKLEIALARLAEQQQAIRHVALGVVRDPHVATDDRLDAGFARGRVELDQPEHVGEIGERQCRHAVGNRGTDRFVDAHHAIDDRVFAMQPEVNEAGQRFATRSLECVQ